MSGRKKRGPRANVLGAKPEPPPFIARMREQIVAQESDERRERQRLRGPVGEREEQEEDCPRVVKVGSDDLSEEEYKRIKLELATKYEIEERERAKPKLELDIETLIAGARREGSSGESGKKRAGKPASEASKRRPAAASSSKKLSYGCSSSESETEE